MSLDPAITMFIHFYSYRWYKLTIPSHGWEKWHCFTHFLTTGEPHGIQDVGPKGRCNTNGRAGEQALSGRDIVGS
jgi:hypothetical protein